MAQDAEGVCNPDLDTIRQMSEGTTINREEVQQFLILLFRSAETQKELTPLFGPEFFDMLKEAPGEYAILTLLGHIAITIPTVTISRLNRSLKEQTRFKESTNKIMTVYNAVYHKLAPSLASANHLECEFKGLKCTSWHGLVCRYVDEATKAIQAGIELASANLKNEMRSVDWKPNLRKIMARLRRGGVRRGEKDVVSDGVVIMQLEEALSALESQGLDVVDDDLRIFAIRLQQELPRAWAFKHGSGKTDFLRLEDAAIELMESCVIPGRAVGPRNAYFRKCKREGLGPARTANKWNRMSIDERRKIAPKAPGNVTESAVKKALQRDQRPDSTGP